MQRKFLEDLGLEKEVIDKIMGENGNDINAEKKKTADKEAENATLQENLKAANETIQGYKDMNIDDIKKSATDWETKYKDMETQLQDVKNTSRLEKEIAGYNTIDSDVLMKLINRDDLVYKDDKIHGLDDQIAKIKESKAYLFQEDKGAEDKGDDRFHNYNPENSAGETNSMAETLNNIFK